MGVYRILRRILALLLVLALVGVASAEKEKKKNPKDTSLAGLVYTTATANRPTDTGYDAVKEVDMVLEGTEYKTQTDGKGMFEFKGVPDGDYVLVCSKAGFATLQKPVHVENGVFPTTLQLVMNPTGSTMVGETPVGKGTVFIAYAARSASAARNDGSGIPLATQQITRGAIAAGADPFSLSGNALNHDQIKPNYEWNPTTTEGNTLMMYPPAAPGKTGFTAVGSMPFWCCFNKQGTILYVSTADQSIMVFDVAHGNTLMRSLPAQGFVTDLQLSPDGRYVVAGIMAATPGIMLIDTKTQEPFGMLPCPPMKSGEAGQPRAVAMSADGGRVFVALGTATSGEVHVIDAATGMSTVSVPVGSSPTGMALSPNGRLLYVANSASATCSVIDTVGMVEAIRIPVGINPQKVAISPDGTRVFVTNKGSNSVSVIDGKSQNVIATTPVGAGPVGVACSPEAARVFVTCKEAGTVVMLDGKTGGVLHTTVPMPNSSPYGVAVQP